MSDTTLTPNMNLVVPTVSVDPGPDWATNTNADWSIIDGHDHSSGKGVPVGPAGMNINADLPFNGNNATSLRAVRMTAQASPIPNTGSDVGEIYVSGNDLYYNDVSGGHQVKITTNGSVNSGAGSINGLPTGTASAAYSAGVFTWQSATSTAANMDAGAYIFRNATANSKGLTLNPPAAMGADISMNLPSLPASTLFMTIDSGGAMGTATGIIPTQIGAASIQGAQIANSAISVTQCAAVGQQVSSSSGTFPTTSSTPIDVTNLSVTITTVGHPVWIGLISDGTTAAISATVASGTPILVEAFVALLRGVTIISEQLIANGGSASAALAIVVPVSSIWHLDVVGAGTYTYKIQLSNGIATSQRASIVGAKLVAYEIK